LVRDENAAGAVATYDSRLVARRRSKAYATIESREAIPRHVEEPPGRMPAAESFAVVRT